VGKSQHDAKLTDLQEAFCHEYLIDLHGAAAARRAGSRAKNPGKQAWTWLQMPAVQARLQELYQERRSRTDLEADFVLQRLRDIADVDPLDIFDSNGCMRPLDEIPASVRKAIASIKTFEEYQGQGRDREYVGRTKELRLWDKPAALRDLGRHLGLWNDKLSIGITEKKAREIIEQAAGVIVRHVKDPTVLAAIRADLADIMGGANA